MSDEIRVLYIDDEPVLRKVAKVFLEQSGNFSVEPIDSALAALDLTRQEKFDAIISDYKMPGMDGITLLKNLKERGDVTPFIIFTGRGREEVAIEALNSGADFYLQKGGDPKSQFMELAHKVKWAVEQRRVEQALRVSEEKYRNLIEHSDEAIVVAQDGMLRLINHRALEMTGYSEQELLSMSFSEVIHPDDRAMVMERYGKQLNGGPSETRYNFRVESKEGITRWVEINIVNIDWEGRPATLNFLTDVTERKQAEDALKIQHDLSIILNNCYSLDDAFEQILNASLKIEGLDSGGIYMADPSTGALDIVAHHGLSIPFIASASHYDADSPQARRSRTGVAYYGRYADIRQPEKDEVRDKENLTAIASIPVMHEGELLSVLNMASHKVDEIPLSTRHALETMAMQVAAALFRIRSSKALEESEERYRNVVEDQTEFICRFLPDGTHVFVNEAYCRYFGLSREDIIGSRFTPNLSREDRKMVERVISSLTPENPVATVEQQIIMPDGNTRWQRWVDRAIFDPEGHLKEYQSVGRDITELKEREFSLKLKNDELMASYVQIAANEDKLRHQVEEITAAQQAFRESEEKYRTVFENTGTATVVLDENNTIELANNGFAQLSGFSKEDIEGKKSWTEFVLPDDLDRMQTQHQLRRRDQKKALTRYEFRFVTKTGEIHFIYLFIDIIPGTKKSVASLLDITTRKQAEELYQTVFENTGTAMIIVEENSVISHVNDEMEKVWGYSREEIEGRVKWHSMVIDEDVEKMMKYHSLRWKDPDALPRDYEFRFIHKNGEVRDGAISVAIIPGTKRTVVSLRDITELKKLDRQVKERTEQVEQLLRQKDEFIAQAGHDLKTPLTPIIALLPHIYKKEQDPELRELLEIVMSDAASMKHLITDILTLAELNKPYTTPETKEMVLVKEIQKGIMKHAWMAQKKDLVIENTVDPDIRIRIAPLHLDSILDNLMSNAIRYTPEGGKIFISSKVSDTDISISVADTGIGLTPEEINRVFDEFFKADMSRHQRDSSGLGLSIVSRIARLYGGSIKAESQGKGSGSTFTVTLPRRR
jgi:PAS domain S-box-containing protein